MQTKLTLRLDEELIERAKAWAKERRVSLSRAVSEFLTQVSKEKEPPTLNSWTRRLTGAASGKGEPPSDEKIRRDHQTYLEAKHR